MNRSHNIFGSRLAARYNCVPGYARRGSTSSTQKRQLSNRHIPGWYTVSHLRIGFLFDTISSASAGTEKQMLAVMAQLARRGCSVHLICLHQSPYLSTAELAFPVHVLGYRGMLKPNMPGVIGSLRTLCRQHQIRVVHAFFEDASVIAWFALSCRFGRDVALVLGRRDLGLGRDDLWYHSLFRALRPLMNRMCDAIVANAQAIREHIERHEFTPACKICVIPNGVDTPTTGQTGPLPPLFQTERVGHWVVICANLKPIKRIDVLIRAIAELARRGVDDQIHAIILGDGHLRGELEALAASLNAGHLVHFEGSVRDVSSYLSQAHVGVLCSDSEGLSNAVLEYMSHGLPVIATAVGGNPELVDETNGATIAPGDHQALARELAALCDNTDLRLRKSAASAQRIAQHHAWHAVVDQWETLSQRLSDATGIRRRSPETHLNA